MIIDTITPGAVESFFIVFLIMLVSWGGAETNDVPIKEWPSRVKTVEIQSTADQSMQAALFYEPETDNPAPLLVALHTWSGDYVQRESIPYAEWCIEHGWIFIHPHFRGPNKNPQATGSECALQDIADAVMFAKNKCAVDSQRIYLVGVSGGGHAALLMAGRFPGLWTAVSVWVPIVDLKAWYAESVERENEYAHDIIQSVGGIPGQSCHTDSVCSARSPITYLSDTLKVRLDINTGINDGYSGSVPTTHAIRAFNAVAKPLDRLSETEMQVIAGERRIPAYLCDADLSDPSYGGKSPVFRRKSGRVRLTIFNGGHEIIFNAALQWLAKQVG